ncbi:hypothetical protein NA57DRAFT_77788 [Rhizodiscina lignyota]|uniref:FAD-binding FR-type domain-containing protein n=1 Tax=Rhizodiscina lignyota TaxID=1504668 RepID=A0A9P4IG27_9PEZI|nr:hypothetical protein NA57DRAFT_77788 [Rhizodiscina lignyota]
MTNPAASDFNDIHDEIVSNDAFKFAHGMTGTDQSGNWLASTVLLFGFLGVVMVTFVFRIWRMLHAAVRRMLTAGTPEKQAFWERNYFPWLVVLRKHYADAPLWRLRHSRDIQLSKVLSFGTIASRYQSLLLGGYILCNIAFCLVIPWKSDVHANTAALRGRSGHLAIFNLIFTVLFALRNNPLIWLLGISFDAFNFCHRWMARIMIVESLMHVICWLCNTYAAGGGHGISLALDSSLLYRWAMVSSVLFLLIGLQAWSPIRRASYGIFLAIHRPATGLSMLALYLHLLYHDLPQLPWMYIIFALLVTEFGLRITRIAYFSLNGRTIARVTVQALPGDASRVTLRLGRPWQPRTGAHIHLYIPRISLFNSHPFSVAWSDDETSITAETTLCETSSGAEGKLPISIHNLEKSPNLSTSQSSTISLVVRARNGFTRRIHGLATKSFGRVYQAWALVEGPYGAAPSLHSYGTVVLFAGGVGITHQLPYVRDLVIRHANGTASIQRLRLIWAVPSTESLEWIRGWVEQILDIYGAADVLRIVVHVSQKNAELSNAKPVPYWAEVRRSRCDATAVVNEEVRGRVGAMAVTVCGPGALADSVRAAARVRMSECSLDFFEESFTY